MLYANPFLARKERVQWARPYHQGRHFLLVRLVDTGSLDGLYGGVWLGVEREAAGEDLQLPEMGSLGGVCGVVCDLLIRLDERLLGASSGVGGCLDGPRPGTRIHLDHVLRWRIGEKFSCPEP